MIPTWVWVLFLLTIFIAVLAIVAYFWRGKDGRPEKRHHKDIQRTVYDEHGNVVSHTSNHQQQQQYSGYDDYQ
jgi:YD repeat-containing protein